MDDTGDYGQNDWRRSTPAKLAVTTGNLCYTFPLRVAIYLSLTFKAHETEARDMYSRCDLLKSVKLSLESKLT